LLKRGSPPVFGGFPAAEGRKKNASSIISSPGGKEKKKEKKARPKVTVIHPRVSVQQREERKGEKKAGKGDPHAQSIFRQIARKGKEKERERKRVVPSRSITWPPVKLRARLSLLEKEKEINLC